MTPLAWFLGLVLALSLVTFAAAPMVAGPARRGPILPLLIGYVAAVGISAALATLAFLGRSAEGAPLPHGRLPYRLQLQGYYGSLDRTLTWAGERGGNTFLLPEATSALRRGEWISLKPAAAAANEPSASGVASPLRWQLTARAWAQPLRVGGTCLNLEPSHWLRSGDTLLVRRNHLYFTVQWFQEEAGHGRYDTRFLFNQGRIRGEELIPDLSEPVLISRLTLGEGRRLSAMLRHFDWSATTAPQPAQQAMLLSRLHQLWNRLRGYATEAPPDLRAGVTANAFAARNREVLRLAGQILWVRRDLEAPASPLGVLIDTDPRLEGARATRRGAEGEVPLTQRSSPQKPLQLDLSPGQDVRYGFAGERVAQLLPGTRLVSDHLLGLLVNVDLTAGPAWRLPEPLGTPFLIMSKETPARLPGLLVDVGLDRQPFYAKASYQAKSGIFRINNGADDLLKPASAGWGGPPKDSFRLGGFERGVIFRFRRDSSTIAYPGVWGAGGLLVGTLACCLSLWGDRRSLRFRLDLAWTLIWGLTLTLLTVRLILAYRLAALPPEDATADELAEIFHKSLGLALAAAWGVPLAMAMVRNLVSGAKPRGPLSRPAGAWRQRLDRLVERTVDLLTSVSTPATGTTTAASRGAPPWRQRLVHGWQRLPRALPLALAVWLLGGLLFERSGAVIGVRFNLASHLLILVGLAAAASWLTNPRTRRRTRLWFVLLWLCGGVIAVVLQGDNGFVIHLPYLLVTGLLLLVWDRQLVSRRGWVAGTVAVAVLAAVAWLLPELVKTPWADRWIAWGVNPANNHLYYRLAPRGTDEDLLSRPASAATYNMTLLLRNSQQRWQMLAFASEGLANARGYGGAPLSDSGMKYATSATDCVFAFYLLSEHGGVAGFLLLLVYAALGALLVSSGWYLSEPWRSRALPLTALGGYFAVTALYMATTNLGLLFFTGQNLPLLSLLSATDVVACMLLLCLATWLLRQGMRESTDAPMSRQPLVLRVSRIWIGVLFVWCGLLGWRMQVVATDEQSFRRDFSFPDAILKTYASHLPEPGKSKALGLSGTHITIRNADEISWVERGLIALFNQQDDKFDPVRSLYYLQSTREGTRLRLNRAYFRLTSPFHPQEPWDGTIEAQGQELATLNLLGKNVILRPGKETAGRKILLDAPALPDQQQSASIVLARTIGGQEFSLCEIRASVGGLDITPYYSSQGGARWFIHVDGQPLTAAGRSLVEGEIVRITGSTVDVHGQTHHPFAENVLYAGRQRPLLAYSRWRNGSIKRITTGGSAASLARGLGTLLDAQKTVRGTPQTPARVILTLQPDLERQLEQILATQAATIYRDSPRGRRQQVSLTVLDAFSGDVLALPTWPIGSDEDAVLEGPERNDNLRNHVIGSTIKPIVLSAVASGFWPSGFDVGQITVSHKSDCSPALKARSEHPHWHCGIAGVELDTPYDCTQPEYDGDVEEPLYLTHSVNFYEVALGMLGLATNPNDWHTILSPTSQSQYGTQVIYGGRRFLLDLHQPPPRRNVFTFDDQDQGRPPVLKAAELEQTLLFQQLAALFGVEVGLDTGDRDSRAAALRTSASAFYPILAGEITLADERLGHVMPDLVDLRPGAFQSSRGDLVSLLIGGAAHGRWSNVRLAEAAARIATGRRVSAHLGVAADPPGAAAATPVASMTPGERATPAAAPIPATSPAVADMPLPLSRREWRTQYVLDPMAEVGITGTAAELKDLLASARARGYRIALKTGTLEESPGGGGTHFESELLMMVVGKWQGGDFVPGRTLAALLYLDDSKHRDSHDWRRAEVARPILKLLLDELDRVAAPPAP
jgi:hypothetical protein